MFRSEDGGHILNFNSPHAANAIQHISIKSLLVPLFLKIAENRPGAHVTNRTYTYLFILAALILSMDQLRPPRMPQIKFDFTGEGGKGGMTCHFTLSGARHAPKNDARARVRIRTIFWIWDFYMKLQPEKPCLIIYVNYLRRRRKLS